MSVQCRGVKRDGARCTAAVSGSNGYCWHHDPDNAARRKEVAARAGASRGHQPAEIQAARSYRRALERIAAAVLDPESDVGSKSAAVAVQAYMAALRALVVESDLRERSEIEARLRRLEEARKWAG